MTLLALAVGSDRVLLIQDSGTFDLADERLTGTKAKIVACSLRMIAGGCGMVSLGEAWKSALTAGLLGETVADVARFGPGFMQSQPARPGATSAHVVAGIDGDGRASAVWMQHTRAYRAERLRPGTILLAPDTRPVPTDPPPTTSDEPVDLVVGDVHGPVTTPERAESDALETVDWPALRLQLHRAVRLQISQKRVPFEPPFVSALLTTDGILFQEFKP